LAVWGGEEPVFWAFTVRSWRQLKGCNHGGPLAGTMEETKYPSGWNEDRAHKLIAHYEQLDENEQVAEDEAAKEAEGPTLMLVPTELVPVVRELIAHKPVE
jgi:hypothetical protein